MKDSFEKLHKLSKDFKSKIKSLKTKKSKEFLEDYWFNANNYTE